MTEQKMRAPAARVTAPWMIPLRQVVERERLARRAHIPPKGLHFVKRPKEFAPMCTVGLTVPLR
jgi:hypothetical protein